MVFFSENAKETVGKFSLDISLLHVVKLFILLLVQELLLRYKLKMDIATEMEFSVEMTCDACANGVKNALKDAPITVISVDVARNEVHVKSALPWEDVQNKIETSGKRAALIGLGSSTKNLGAAVAEISGKDAKGVVRMVQLNDEMCLFDGTIHGLEPGSHGISVHEFGDLTQGCNSCGGHYNPHGHRHGGRLDKTRHLGDLGNITAERDGRASFKFTDDRLKVWEMIGRSLVIHQNPDDLGQGVNEKSKIDGNAGPGVACAIIARSAGLFQNVKRFCSCDGVSLFDERNVPIVGKERTKQKL